MGKSLNYRESLNLGGFAFVHGLVDAVCCAILVGLYAKEHLPLPVLESMAVMYNILAFGLQPILGMISDRFQNWRMQAIISLIMIAFALTVTYFSPWIAVIIAGIGNAIFHIA